MPKSFAELLAPKIVINTKTLENEQMMIEKTKKSSSGGNIQNFGPLKFSLEPLNLSEGYRKECTINLHSEMLHYQDL